MKVNKHNSKLTKMNQNELKITKISRIQVTKMNQNEPS